VSQGAISPANIFTSVLSNVGLHLQLPSYLTCAHIGYLNLRCDLLILKTDAKILVGETATRDQVINILGTGTCAGLLADEQLLRRSVFTKY
jgi:hypothetical protein